MLKRVTTEKQYSVLWEEENSEAFPRAGRPERAKQARHVIGAGEGGEI
jgi:hypothetical protein